MDGYKLTVHPLHAFPFIDQRDQELRARRAAYWCVAVWRLESDEPICLDHWARLDVERLCFQIEAARDLRAHHPIADMRRIYDHCLVFLEHELKRRGVFGDFMERAA